MVRTRVQNEPEKESQVDLRWNPPGKRKLGRPKMALRKTFQEDFKKMELTWETAKRKAKETFMEEKEQLHYPEWIDAIKENI